MHTRVSTLLHSFLLIVFLGSFSSILYYLRRQPVAAPARVLPAAAVPLAQVPVAAVPEAGWSLLQPGLEKRLFEIHDSEGRVVESLHVWRLDQSQFRLDVAYDDRPSSLEAWQQATGASIVLNGGYYSIENDRYFPDGLTIVDGRATGRTFRRGGMLAIREDGADLRWLVEQPYDPYESLQAALQSFPILVRPDGGLGVPAVSESHARARRTVIAQDRAGRILFMVAPLGHFTLHELSAYLAESDLDLEIAVNLDGGGSTGILVANPHELISPTRPIPFVLLVYPR